MSRKIIGVTVGTQLPKPNFKQTDPTKGDYIKNKPDFEGLKTQVNAVSDLVGDTKVSDQIETAISAIDYPVDSVNGKTGAVVLNASDVGALPDTTEIPSIEGLATEEYVNNAIGAIPTPDVSGQLNTHNTDANAHNDIRTQLNTKAAASDVAALQNLVGDTKVSKQINDAISEIPTPDVSGQINTHNSATNSHSDIRGQISSLSSEIANKADASHNQAASTITAGTFAGQVAANGSGQTYNTYCLRNTRLASSDTNPTVNGQICWTYK